MALGGGYGTDFRPPIPTTITIRHSTRALLEAFHETARFRIRYSDNNDPQAQFQHRSSPHEGVAFLELDADSDINRLTGRYYTMRKTTGDIDILRVSGGPGKLLFS